MKLKRLKRPHAGDKPAGKKVKKKHMRPPTLTPAENRPDTMVQPSTWAHLIAYCLCTLERHKPNHFEVTNKHAITKAVAIFAPGIETDFFLDSEAGSRPQIIKSDEYPSLKQFEFAWPTKGHVNKQLPISIIGSAMRLLVDKRERNKILDKARIGERDSVPLTSFEELLLNEGTMSGFEYTLVPKDSEWIEIPDTRDRELPLTAEDLWAVDCEMVVTEGGQRELAQIAVTNSDFNELYKVYVKPAKPVIDYKYEFSGITPEILEGATVTLGDVQDWFKKHLRPNTVLVGHSLSFDLNVMKIVYHNVIDTAALYSYPGGSNKIPSLRWLAEYYLKKTIQKGKNGHDPAIDANTAMELVLRKHMKGNYSDKDRFHISLPKILSEKNKTTAIVSQQPQKWAEGYAQTMKLCKTDDEIATMTIQLAQTHDLTVCRLMALEDADVSLSKKDAKVQMNARIQKIVESVPANTLLIVFTEHGNVDKLAKLMKKTRLSGGDFEQDVMSLKEENRKAVISATFATIKRDGS